MRDKLLKLIKPLVVVALVYGATALYIGVLDTSMYPTGFPVHGGGDSGEYALLAENLYYFGTFSLTAPAFTPEMFRTPGYPAFVAATYRVDHSFGITVVLQIILVLATIFFIVEFAALFVPRAWALAVGLIYAFDPTTLVYGVSLFSDTLFVFLLFAALYALFVLRPSWRVALFAGLALGLASLTRPLGEYLALIAVVGYTSRIYRTIGWRQALTLASLVVVMYGACVVPWYVRNHAYSGVYSLSSAGAYTVLFFDVYPFLTERLHEDPATVDTHFKEVLDVSHMEVLKSTSYVPRMNALIKASIGEHLVPYALYHAIGSANLFIASGIRDALNNLPRAHGWLQAHSLIASDDVNIKVMFRQGAFAAGIYSIEHEPLYTAERVVRLCILVLAGIGVTMLLLRRRHLSLVLLVVVMMAYIALATGPVSYPRYRMPLEPLELIVAAVGILQIISCFKSINRVKSDSL